MTGHRASALIITFLAFACGGQTHGEPSNAGGSTTGGDGGAAAAGATGGMAGTGAMSGAGGTGGTTQENAIGTMVAAVCIALSDSQCSVEWCLADFVGKDKHAKAYDCQVELSAFLQCTLNHPLACIEGSGVPTAYYDTAPDCATQYEALLACFPKCDGGSGDDGCTIHCDAKIPWEVKCTKSAGWTHCVGVSDFLCNLTDHQQPVSG